MKSLAPPVKQIRLSLINLRKIKTNKSQEMPLIRFAMEFVTSLKLFSHRQEQLLFSLPGEPLLASIGPMELSLESSSKHKI